MTIETQAELVHALRRMSEGIELVAETLNKQNKLIEKSIETCQRSLAVNILNAKVNAKTAVLINALSVLDHKEFIELINQV